MVVEIDLKSIPPTQSLTVFESRYWSLLRSCFQFVFTVFDEISNLVMTAKESGGGALPYWVILGMCGQNG